ncbi:MAG: DoxX family protein [Flavobacterium sp.]|nr:MAG: DoxX family protein [Flavobacterium sp.]
MRIAVIIVRVLMGLMFLQASVMFFLKMYPAQPEMSKDVMTYMNGLTIGHTLEIIKTIELLCAICFLVGRYVALATVVLFPITVNILLFHTLLDPSNMLVAVLIFIAHVFLLFAYRKNYAGMLQPKRIE